MITLLAGFSSALYAKNIFPFAFWTQDQSGGGCAPFSTEFTSDNLSWQVPAGCTQITVQAWGGGGGGGYGDKNNNAKGGKGGGGGYVTATLTATPGETLAVYVGKGGTGGWCNGSSRPPGGTGIYSGGAGALGTQAPQAGGGTGSGGAGGTGMGAGFNGAAGGGPGCGQNGANAFNNDMGGGGGGGACLVPWGGSSQNGSQENPGNPQPDDTGKGGLGEADSGGAAPNATKCSTMKGKDGKVIISGG